MQNLVNCVKRANREFAQSFETVQKLVTFGVAVFCFAKLFAKHSSLFFIRTSFKKVFMFRSSKRGSKGGFFIHLKCAS